MRRCVIPVGVSFDSPKAHRPTGKPGVADVCSAHSGVAQRVSSLAGRYDLIRARATAVRVLGKTRQHLHGFLLRHGRVYAGKRGWTLAYRRWLSTVRFDHPAQQVVLRDYIHAVTDSEARVVRLTVMSCVCRNRARSSPSPPVA
ncbi:MAG: hypothetical protein FD119_4115, partial [Stygiobacter sp.]